MGEVCVCVCVCVFCCVLANIYQGIGLGFNQ